MQKKKLTYKEKRILQKDNSEQHKEFIDENVALLHGLSSDDSVIDKFNQEVNQAEPIRELFTDKNIKLKTQVTEEQRHIISVLYYCYQECLRHGIEFRGLKNVLDEFVIFGVPMDRQSRKEYVESHKQAMQNQFGQPNNFNMNPMQQQMRR